MTLPSFDHARVLRLEALVDLSRRALEGIDLDDLLAVASTSVARCLGVPMVVFELVGDRTRVRLSAGVGWPESAPQLSESDLGREPRAVRAAIESPWGRFGVLAVLPSGPLRAFSESELEFVGAVAAVLGTAVGRKQAAVAAFARDATERRRAERLSRALHDAEQRRRQALELNDNVIQGLAAVGYSLEAGREDIAREVAASTLESARAILHDLMSAESLEPDDLVRERAAPSHVGATGPARPVPRPLFPAARPGLEISAPADRDGPSRMTVLHYENAQLVHGTQSPTCRP